MKKIAVMGSGNGSNFEAIAKYFADKKVDITCLSNAEDAYILERADNLEIKNMYLPFEDNYKFFSENKFDLIVLAGYMKILPEEVLSLGKFINIHPSLLPAFPGKDAMTQAFFTGVKVSGVTIHWVEKDVDCGKIIAQYPILIDNLTHFDEFKEQMHELEHLMYPIVIEKILNDEVFDFSDLLGGGGCSGCGGHSNEEGHSGCGGCGGCH